MASYVAKRLKGLGCLALRRKPKKAGTNRKEAADAGTSFTLLGVQSV